MGHLTTATSHHGGLCRVPVQGITTTTTTTTSSTATAAGGAAAAVMVAHSGGLGKLP